MPPLGDPSGSSTPVRKNQVAKKSTAKKPRNLAPPPRPVPPPPPVIEIITLDSDEDEEDVKSTAAEMKIEAGTPQSEPSEVGESPMKTEESPVKQELSESDSDNEEEQLVTVRPEPTAVKVLKSDPDEPRTPRTRRSRSIESDTSPPPPSVQENENPEDQSSPDGPLVLNDFEDDQSEAQRTLEEAFAERRKIQEARWRCQQQGIGLDGQTPSRRDFNRKAPNLVVTFRKVEFKKRGHPARATPLKAVAGTQYRMGSSVFDTPGQPMPLQTPQVPLTERRKMQENRRRLLKLQEKIRRQQHYENNCQSEAETSGSQESQEAVIPVPDEDQMPPAPAPDEAIPDQPVEIEATGVAEEANLPQQMDVEDQDDECWNWEEVPMDAVSNESENNGDCPVGGTESQTQSTAQNPLKELREAREARWRQSQQGSSAASTISTTLTTPVVEVPEVPIQSESHITALREEALRQDELSEHRRMQENRWRQQVQDGVRAQPGPSRKRKKPSPDARANQEIQWFQRNNDPLIPENNFAAVAGSVAQNIRRSNRDVTFSTRGSRVLQNGVERFISGMLSDANAIAGSTGRKTIKGKDVKLALRLARERRN